MRHILLLFTFMPLVTMMMGQSSEFSEAVQKLIYQAKYGEAQAAIDQQLKQAQPKAIDYAIARSLQGKLNHELARFPAAQAAFQEALTVFDSLRITDANYLYACAWAGANERILAQYQRAEMILRQGLEAAEKLGESPAAAVKSELLLERALLEQELCQYAEADQHFRASIDWQARIQGANHPSLGRLINYYVIFLTNYQLNYPQARQWNARAQEILAPFKTDYPFEYASALVTQADQNINHGDSDFSLALNLYEEAIDHLARHLGEDHPEYARLLLAKTTNVVLYTESAVNKVEAFDQMLLTLERSLGRAHPRYLEALNLKALCLSTIGNLAQIKELKEEGLSLTRSIFGENHPQTALALQELSAANTSIGEFITADSLWQLSHQYTNQFFTPGHRAWIANQETRKTFWSQQGKLTMADSLANTIALAWEKLLGKDNTHYWGAVEDRAMLAFYRGDTAVATNLYSEVFSHLADLHGKENILYLSKKLNYLKTCKRVVSFRETLTQQYPAYLQALADKIGKENFFYAQYLGSYIDFLIEARDYPAAEGLLPEHGRLCEMAFGRVSYVHSNHLSTKEQVLQATKIPAARLPVLQEQLAIWRELGNLSQVASKSSRLAGLYRELGQYDNAKATLEGNKALIAANMGKDNFIYFQMLLALHEVFLATGQMIQAEEALRELDERLKTAGTFQTYSDALLSLWVNMYLEAGTPAKALSILDTIRDERLQQLYLNMRGRTLQDLEEYQEAEKCFLQALELALKEGEDPTHLYNNLAVLYSNMGRREEALDYAKKALDLAGQALGTNTPQYVRYLSNYAAQLDDNFEEDAAEQAYLTALRILEQTTGKLTPQYAATLQNYASSLTGTDLQKAASLFKEALQIAESTLGKEHPQYLSILNNLVDTYQKLNDYERAEACLRYTLETWRRLAPNGSDYAASLQMYGKFLQVINQDSLAIVYFQQALDIVEALLPNQITPRKTNLMGAIASSYHDLGRLEQALKYSEQQNALTLHRFGESSMDYAVTVSDLAVIQLELKQWKESEANLWTAINFFRNSRNGENDIRLAFYYEQLARLHEATGRLPEATEMAEKALTLYEAHHTPDHSETLAGKKQLATVLLKSGKKTEGIRLLDEVMEGWKTSIRKSFTYLPFSQQPGYIEDLNILHLYPSLAAMGYDSLAGMAYDFALLQKGRSLANNRTIQEIAQTSAEAELKAAWENYRRTQKQITQMYRRPKTERAGLAELEDQLGQAEKTLMAFAPYRAYIEEMTTKWKAIQQALSPDEAGIEFIRYRHYDVSLSDSALYAALVLRPGQAPVFVALCAEADLSDLQNPIYFSSGGGLYRGPEAAPMADPIILGINLYQKLWAPIEQHLAGVRRIYYAPDGLLHRVNFDALNEEEDDQLKFLLDRYDLVRMTSTRQVLKKGQNAPVSPGDFLTVGDIDYGVAATGANRSVWFSPLNLNLPGPSEFQLNLMLGKKAGQKIDYLSGKQATEPAVVKALEAKKYRAIFLITHGVTLPDERLLDKMAHLYHEANPLQRSALVFAGINEISAPEDYARDGILTAMDVLPLDLQGTELVCIPACRSALGDIKGKEGAFSLPRAFHQAGARYVIAGLWDLENAATTEFMRLFYQQWLEDTVPIPQAFKATQRVMRGKYGQDINKWGGLVLVE